MTTYLEHLTVEGERWDLLAWRYYRDALAYERILAANPDVPVYPILPGGIMLLIPVVEVQTTAPKEKMPPWKR